MVAWALGRHLAQIGRAGTGTLTGSGTTERGALSDAERLSLDRLGEHKFWRWVQRGRWDSPQRWERDGE